MKTIMELVSAQIKPRRSPYKVRPCEIFEDTINITGRNFSLSLGHQLQFSYKGYAFILLKEAGLWHFMCEQTETSEDPLTVSPELEERAFKHMTFIVRYFSPKITWRFEKLQMIESIMMN